MINILKIYFRKMAEWLNPRHCHAVVLRPDRVDNPHHYYGRENGSRQRPSFNQFASDELDPASAAEEIYNQAHIQENYVEYGETPSSGRILARIESWDYENGVMRNRIARALTTAVSGGVVPVDQLRARCMEPTCRGLEDVRIRCATCGIALCRLHSHVLQTPTSTIVFCLKHLNLAVHEWDTWEAFDISNGATQKSPVFPGRPASVAKYGNL